MEYYVAENLKVLYKPCNDATLKRKAQKRNRYKQILDLPRNITQTRTQHGKENTETKIQIIMAGGYVLQTDIHPENGMAISLNNGLKEEKG